MHVLLAGKIEPEGKIINRQPQPPLFVTICTLLSFDTIDVTNKFVRSENYNTAIVLKKILVKVQNLRLYLAQ